MTELNVVQGSDEWMEERIGRVTGSHFDTLMPTKKQKIDEWNKTQLSYLRKVAAEILTGTKELDYKSRSMEWGNTNEPFACTEYEDRFMVVARECGIFIDGDHLGSSPDRIIGEMERILEIKCPESKQHLRYLLDPQELFDEYPWQCKGECLFTGINKGTIISYDPRFLDPEKRLAIHDFEVSKKDLDMMRARLALAVQMVKDMAGIEDKPIEGEFEEVQGETTPEIETVIEKPEIIEFNFDTVIEKPEDELEIEIL